MEEKGIRKYFFMGTMFLFNGNSIVFLLHFEQLCHQLLYYLNFQNFDIALILFELFF